MMMFACFISFTEPKDVGEAFDNEFLVGAIHEEVEQFHRLDVWNLVPKPENVNVVGNKWIFKNNIDEYGYVIRKKQD